MQTTLLIMLLVIGSRFGGGIKQLEPVDEQGHIIMDYSIHDAIEQALIKWFLLSAGILKRSSRM